jgi:hypothetical protein
LQVARDCVVPFFKSLVTSCAQPICFHEIGCHLNRLVSYRNNRIVFTHFELAERQVLEAKWLQSKKIFVGLFILRSFLFRVVVCTIAKVVVAINFLVNFSSFLKVSSFEEVTSFGFESVDVINLLSNRQLVEVARILDAIKTHNKDDRVSIFKRFVLIEVL